MESSLNDSQLLSLIKEYTEQLKQDPNADVFCQLAKAYVSLGLIDVAVTALQKGLIYNPQHLFGQLFLAELLGKNEQYDEAVAGYEKVLQKRPDCVEALLGVARLNLQQTNRAKAKSYLEKARLLQPDNPEIPELTKQINESVTFADEGGNMPLVSATIAELYCKQGLREKAVEVYKILVRQQPENEVLQARLNELLDRAGTKARIDCAKIEEKLEGWLGAIQRRRKNV